MEACVIDPVFWIMRLGCAEAQRQKLAYVG